MSGMLEMDTGRYERLTRTEALLRYGWGRGIPEGSEVLVWDGAANKVFAAIGADGNWCCEVEGWRQGADALSWRMLGQGFACTADEALAAAVVDMVGPAALCEQSSAEAVSACASMAAHLAFGEGGDGAPGATIEEALLSAARDYVRRNCRFASFEWED